MHVAGGLPDSGTDTRANPGGWVQTECCTPASHVCLGESGAKKMRKIDTTQSKVLHTRHFCG